MLLDIIAQLVLVAGLRLHLSQHLQCLVDLCLLVLDQIVIR